MTRAKVETQKNYDLDHSLVIHEAIRGLWENIGEESARSRGQPLRATKDWLMKTQDRWKPAPRVSVTKSTNPIQFHGRNEAASGRTHPWLVEFASSAKH